MAQLSNFRRPLIFGGSFDPPHVGHVALPAAVARAIEADGVVYIPAGRAPHKLDQRQTDPHHRLAMLRLALAPGSCPDAPGTLIRTDEIDRVEDGRPSYTVDTLEAFAEELHPDATMRLLIGVDQVRIFDSWREWRRVIELAEPVVMRRGDEPRPQGDSGLPPEWENRVVDVPAVDVSSTEVRRRVAAGASLEGRVVPAVAEYIAEHGLYEQG
jgi:nicotinate-nucleotide adenylyltransferase